LASSQQTVAINVGGSLAADRTFYCRVTATDPNGGLPPLFTQTPLPPFFTGAQAIGDAFVLPFAETAQVFWGANVIGLGQVEILSPAGLGPFDDGLNVQNHSLLLTGLLSDSRLFLAMARHKPSKPDRAAKPEERGTNEVCQRAYAPKPRPNERARCHSAIP
jgi:hypothetical protein